MSYSSFMQTRMILPIFSYIRLLRLSWIFLLSLPIICAQEEKPEVFFMHHLVNQVLERNPNLFAVRERVKAAQFTIPRVQILDDPQFMVKTMHNPLTEQSKFMPMVRFELSQALPTSGKLWVKGLAAKKTLDVVKSEEITTQQELILQAKKAYLQLLLNYIAQKINLQNQRIVERIIASTLALYKVGKGAQEEILKAKIDLQILKNDDFTLKSEQEGFEAMINVLLNNPQSAFVAQPVEKFHKPLSFSLKKLVRLALQKRPELQGRQAMVEEQQAMVKLAQHGYYPDTMVGVMYEKARHGGDYAWGASIGINVPLWASFKQRREVQEAQARVVAQKNSLYGLQTMICGRIREILAKIHASDKQIDLYRNEIVPKTVQTLAASHAKYRVGKRDFLFLLDTRRQLHNVQLAYYRLKIEREVLLAELERAVGVPLENFAEIVTSIS